MSDNEIIDVEYSETDNNSESKDIVVNDPMSAAVNGFFGAVNHITDAVKEYNICHDQEETKRAEIRAKLNLGMAEINAKKEIVLKQLDNKHELDMKYINTYCDSYIKEVDTALTVINVAVENAKQTNDFSCVIELMKLSNDIFLVQSRFMTDVMNKRNDNLLLSGMDRPAGYLT